MQNIMDQTGLDHLTTGAVECVAWQDGCFPPAGKMAASVSEAIASQAGGPKIDPKIQAESWIQ